MEKYPVVFILIIIFSYSGTTFSQNKEELERQRQEANEIISNTTRLLEQTSETRQNTLEKLNIVNRRLQIRENLITTIESEIGYLDNSIQIGQNRITELEKNLKETREAYARMINLAYKQRSAHQQIMFILSASNFNQAYRRFIYLRQYAKSRQKQILKIKSLTEEIIGEIDDMEFQKGEKVTLLMTKKNETSLLSQERQQQNSIIQDLRRKESELKEELTRQQRVARALQNAIEELLKKEAEIAVKERIYELTPEEKIISDKFQNNKGGLPWPTDRGVVTGFFGEHSHPVLRGIKIQNNGIDISTVGNAEVRAVFEGIVRQVLTVPGANNVIIIRHGNYLSLYANLSHVYVRSGDKVQTKQLIGRVFTDNEDDDKSVLHLEIWEENMKLDPILWLSRQ